jgi:hypothetical protein
MEMMASKGILHVNTHSQPWWHHVLPHRQRVLTLLEVAEGEACRTYGVLCEISSSHGGKYDVQSCLLGYTAV